MESKFFRSKFTSLYYIANFYLGIALKIFAPRKYIRCWQECLLQRNHFRAPFVYASWKSSLFLSFGIQFSNHPNSAIFSRYSTTMDVVCEKISFVSFPYLALLRSSLVRIPKPTMPNLYRYSRILYPEIRFSSTASSLSS